MPVISLLSVKYSNFKNFGSNVLAHFWIYFPMWSGFSFQGA